jgi:hypothetical protein
MFYKDVAPLALGNFSWCDARPHPGLLPRGEGMAIAPFDFAKALRQIQSRNFQKTGERFSLSWGRDSTARQ